MTNDNGVGRRVLPPVYFLVAILAIAALHRWLPLATVIVAPYTYVGAVIIGVGLVLNLVSVRLFAVHSTAIKPFEESSSLVTGGFYRITRNPMYLGMVIILIGIAALFGTLASFVPIPIFAWLIQTHFILKEEAMLADTFGDEYLAYKDRVRRWI